MAPYCPHSLPPSPFITTVSLQPLLPPPPKLEQHFKHAEQPTLFSHRFPLPRNKGRILSTVLGLRVLQPHLSPPSSHVLFALFFRSRPVPSQSLNTQLLPSSGRLLIWFLACHLSGFNGTPPVWRGLPGCSLQRSFRLPSTSSSSVKAVHFFLTTPFYNDSLMCFFTF